MPHLVVNRLLAAWPAEAWRDVTAVIAVSGGPDSVALLRALHALKQSTGGPGALVAAHYNHRLRGTQADQDQQFVIDLCRQLGVACETNSAVTTSTQCGPTATDDVPDSTMQNLEDRDGDDSAAGSDGLADSGRVRTSEKTARDARYQFLRHIVARRGARYLATAHTADDQAETVLHRILRGTGVDGLSGMAVARQFMPGVTLVRPLLAASRQEVLDYLQSLQQNYCVDATNDSLQFTRNRLRHDLLPRLERDYNPRVKDALCRLAALARESAEVTECWTRDKERAAVLHAAPEELALDCPALSVEHPYLVRQLLMRLWGAQGWPLGDMTLEKWNQVADLIQKPPVTASGKLSLPGAIVAQRLGDRLHIQRGLKES
jgi:tRNA(Ile)-lysidine synthase